MGKILFVVEMLELLISILFSLVMDFVFIRRKKLESYDKRFNAFIYGIALYVVLRIIEFSIYAYYSRYY